ncbi:MAG: hypothetical protein WCD35_14660 [Mycobacteriales bacterium]
MTEPTPLVAVVVAALAGVRTGQAVLVLGPAGRLGTALEAGTGCPLVTEGPADVVVALAAPDIPSAVTHLRPGGRLVALAADRGAVERTVARHGLALQHAEEVGGRVAWSARLPT